MATNKEKLQILVEAQGIAKTKAQLNTLEKSMGGVGKVSNTMKFAVAGAAAAVGVGLFKGLSASIRVGKEFEQSMANVKAVSGATDVQFRALEKSAMALGASTKFTASEVAGLQTEYAKLGFTATEINNVTKGTLDLASAVGADLAEAATVAGSTLRGFGMDTKNTTRVTDVMAKSFSSSALDMQKFSDSMKYVAPVAKLAGFGVEGTTAMLGQLANAGIDGSMAGTALRKIFLELSNESSKLSDRLGGPISSVDELVPALQKLNDEGVSTAEMKDLVGQRAVSAFSILLDGAGDVDVLTESLRGAGGSAKEMADIQLATLEGKLTIMMSALSALGITIFKLIDGPINLLVTGFTGLINITDDVLSFFTESEVAAKKSTKTMKQHEASIRGIIKANKDLTISQQEQLLEESQNKLNKLTQEYIMARDNAEMMTFVWKERNAVHLETIRLREEEGLAQHEAASQALALVNEMQRQTDLEIANRDAILESVNAQGEQVAAAQERIDQLKQEAEIKAALKEAEGNGENGENGGTTEAEKNAVKLSELDAFLIEEHKIRLKSQGLELEMQEAHYTALAQTEAERDAIEEIFAKKKQQRKRQEINDTMASVSSLASMAAEANTKFAGSEKASARLKQIAAVANAYMAASDTFMSFGGWPLGVIPAGIALSTGLAQAKEIEKSIGQMKTAATGMDEIVDQPTTILAGEAGPEQVSITPLEGPNVAGPGGGGGENITVKIEGNVMTQEFVENELADAIKSAMRKGRFLS